MLFPARESPVMVSKCFHVQQASASQIRTTKGKMERK